MSRWYEDDPDAAPCGRCGKDVALAHDEPCPHGWVACPECGWAAVCAECREQAEREMFASEDGVGLGPYDEKADPLLDHLAPERAPEPLHHRAGDAWVESDPMEGQR